MDLKYVKEASLIALADYAVANKIDGEPDFAWWVHYVFKKRDRIIANNKTKYWRTTYTYGVTLPKTSAEALELDKQPDHTFWKVFEKEMVKAEISYKEVEGCTPGEVRQGEVDKIKVLQ